MDWQRPANEDRRKPLFASATHAAAALAGMPAWKRAGSATWHARRPVDATPTRVDGNAELAATLHGLHNQKQRAPLVSFGGPGLKRLADRGWKTGGSIGDTAQRETRHRPSVSTKHEDTASSSKKHSPSSGPRKSAMQAAPDAVYRLPHIESTAEQHARADASLRALAALCALCDAHEAAVSNKHPHVFTS